MTSFVVVFPLRLRHLQNKVFEHSNSLFWWRKSLATHFFFMCGNKEKSLVVKSGVYGVWPFNKVLIWADVWERALAWWTMIRLLYFVFQITRKTLGKQIGVYHSTMLKWNSRHMTVICVVYSDLKKLIWQKNWIIVTR